MAVFEGVRVPQPVWELSHGEAGIARVVLGELFMDGFWVEDRGIGFLAGVYMGQGHAGPPGVGDDVSDDQLITAECLCDRLKSSHQCLGGGCLGADHQVGGGGPLHTNHMDVQMFWEIAQGGIDTGSEVNERRAAGGFNLPSVPDYCLWKEVAF